MAKSVKFFLAWPNALGPPPFDPCWRDAARIDASNNQLQQLPDLSALGENLVNIQLAQNRLLKLPDAGAEFALAFGQELALSGFSTKGHQ